MRHGGNPHATWRSIAFNLLSFDRRLGRSAQYAFTSLARPNPRATALHSHPFQVDLDVHVEKSPPTPYVLTRVPTVLGRSQHACTSLARPQSSCRRPSLQAILDLGEMRRVFFALLDRCPTLSCKHPL